jgi:hypothetical protein
MCTRCPHMFLPPRYAIAAHTRTIFHHLAAPMSSYQVIVTTCGAAGQSECYCCNSLLHSCLRLTISTSYANDPSLLVRDTCTARRLAARLAMVVQRLDLCMLAHHTHDSAPPPPQSHVSSLATACTHAPQSLRSQCALALLLLLPSRPHHIAPHSLPAAAAAVAARALGRQQQQPRGRLRPACRRRRRGAPATRVQPHLCGRVFTGDTTPRRRCHCCVERCAWAKYSALAFAHWRTRSLCQSNAGQAQPLRQNLRRHFVDLPYVHALLAALPVRPTSVRGLHTLWSSAFA